MQVPKSRRPVRQRLHAHCPEHALKRPGVPGLNAPASDSFIAGHLLEALLADRPQREMIIKQPAQQLPPVAVKTLLELGVRETRGAGSVQKANQSLKLLTTTTKPRHPSSITQPAAAGSCCIVATNLPVRQEFITRRVKFPTTGVDIGGHVGHLHGRRCT